MLDVASLLEEIKASPYEEHDILAPHTGVVTFPTLKAGDKVHGPQGTWKEKPGTLLVTIERERNPKLIHAPMQAEVAEVHERHSGAFVEAGTPLLRLRHYLSRDEVVELILKKALHLFLAPERATYYFVPELDKKIKASGHRAIKAQDGMEMFIMSRMKREAPVYYSGPEGLVYAVYFQHNEVKDAGDPLIGVCAPDQLDLINDVVMRVRTEWREPE